MAAVEALPPNNVVQSVAAPSTAADQDPEPERVAAQAVATTAGNEHNPGNCEDNGASEVFE